MTMGLDWAEHEIGTAPPQGIDRFADLFRHKVTNPPGSRFVHASRGVDLFLIAGYFMHLRFERVFLNGPSQPLDCGARY